MYFRVQAQTFEPVSSGPWMLTWCQVVLIVVLKIGTSFGTVFITVA